VTHEWVVLAEGLSKRFKIYASSLARLVDWLGLPPRPRYRDFWAVRDVSFRVGPGECLGIIGPNGAGKTTLLKLLTGVLRPTAGRLETRGRVLSLLELGSDFNPELTGRQNAEETMRLLGVPSAGVGARLSEIEAFAELGEFFDRPVKMYSSGMFVRLAFSLFSTMDPEVFLVDEALTVGDLRFSGKALARIREMRARGTTLLFVSHNLEIVNQLCTRVLWVQAGRVQMDGAPHDVTGAYTQFMVHGGAAPPPPIGQPTAPAPAQAAPSGGGQVQLGRGWHALEAYEGDIFRWAEDLAELIVDPPPDSPELLLEIEPGPSVAVRPLPLYVDSGAGLPTEVAIADRQEVRIPLPAGAPGPHRVRVWTPMEGQPVLGDGRQLAFRAFRWGWSGSAELDSIQTLAPQPREALGREIDYELRAMHGALRSAKPVRNAGARLVRVVTRNSAGDEAATFTSFDEVSLEITVEALRDVHVLVVGIEIKDVYARGLYRTRNDDQADTLPSLAAHERATVKFCCPRLLLGRGAYSITVGLAGEGRENEIWQLVERAWSFEVWNSVTKPFYGVVDLDWRYVGAPVLDRVS
jgi:ABC-type polysaccharide/polyol phosphate transport system ATPase subunit